MAPQWYITARTNSTLAVADTAIEQSFESLTLIKRLNYFGSWLLQLRIADPHAATFLPQSGGYPNGILVSVDNQDGQGLQLVMSGPQLSAKVVANANNEYILQASGVSDDHYLYRRLALPTPFFPYVNDVILPFTPLSYYQLAESSGTTATDSGSRASNGTYNGGFTLAQTGLIDDPSTSVKFNGTTGYVSVPTAGLPTGNNHWTIMALGYLTALPAGNITLFSFGTNAAKQGAQMGVLATSGLPFVDVAGVATVSGTTAVPLNQPFLMAMVYDGTTLTGYLNGVIFGTQVPGTLTVAYGTAQIGAFYAAGGNFWPGQIGHCAIFSSALTNTNAFDLSGKVGFQLWAYLVGLSKSAYQEYSEGGGGGHTSLAIAQYVDANGAAGIPARNIPNISVPTPSNIGTLPLATFARFDNLLDWIAGMNLQGSPEIGFKLEQSGTQLVFSCFTLPDQTASAIFSRDFYGAQGNILDYSWEYGIAGPNYYYAGGSNPTPGTLVGRAFGEGSDATSITQFGRWEGFLDWRSAPGQPTAVQAINAALAQTKAKVVINATLIDQPGILYFKGPSGQGYDLGSKVTVILDGQTFQEVIRQVQIDLQPGQPAVVQAAIGTPIEATVLSEQQALVSRFTSITGQQAPLQTNF